jgi:hypothetical protein
MEDSMAEGTVNASLAEKITGKGRPRDFTLDASVLDQAKVHEVIREDVKQNKIVFRFPAGLNTLDLYEECLALTKIDDFSVMYDITMQLLVDKDLEIYIKDDNGNKQLLCAFHVVDRYQDLRGEDTIDRYPILVTWLTEFIGASLAKKYPLPGEKPHQPEAAKKGAKAKK